MRVSRCDQGGPGVSLVLRIETKTNRTGTTWGQENWKTNLVGSAIVAGSAQVCNDLSNPFVPSNTGYRSGISRLDESGSAKIAGGLSRGWMKQSWRPAMRSTRKDRPSTHQ